MTDAPPQLVLGPLTRYADTSSATVWVETSAPCEVEVLGRSTRTFSVEGHHYALVVVDGLPAATDQPYDVRLDGRRVWPPDDGRPQPRIRTIDASAPLRVVLGSCRVDRPHREPWTLRPGQDALGVGVDALAALSRSIQRGERPLPDLLLHMGDQVYADEGLAPEIRKRQVERRGAASEPSRGVADFEEYTWLYVDSWSDADVRWLLSTVPSAMIFDDHDVRDDWNTSQAWRHEVQALPWWHERITGAYMSYWVYQHLGNQSPAAIAEDGLLADLRDGAEPGRRLRELAEHADDEVDGRKLSRWSFVRELGAARLVVVDTRSGRVLEDHRRSMLSEPEWDFVEEALRGDCEHLLVVASVPLVLSPGLHDVEGWDEAVCAGAWGRTAARGGEWIRQALDLEHWAAFQLSFERLARRLGEVASGERGRRPASVLVLSGDVHHSYVAPLAYDGDDGTWSPVAQVVSSPLRNAYPRKIQRVLALAHTRTARVVGRLLARSVGLPRPAVRWHMRCGPIFENSLATLLLEPGRATVRLERAVPHGGTGRLERAAEAAFGRDG